MFRFLPFPSPPHLTHDIEAMRPPSSPTTVIESVSRSLRGALITPVVLTPLVIGGAALILKRTGLLQRLFDGESESVRRAQALGRAIVGNDKHSIAAVLGLPEASSGAASPRAVFLADTWYYRLDGRHCIALAIGFSKDVASDVRVLHVKREGAKPLSGRADRVIV